MKVIILSRQPKLYSTTRLVETGEKLGHKMRVGDHLKCNIELEKEKPKLYYQEEYLENIGTIIPRIGAFVTFHGTAVVRQFKMMKILSP
ncbi:MAG: ribosomal protein S6--L-glutamate ligase [Polaribacter sp.]|jgi:ribosomal protein S6--L-glutamate ligase